MSIKKRIPYHIFSKENPITNTYIIDDSTIFREYFQARQSSTDVQSNSDFDFSEFSKEFNKKNKLSKRRIKKILQKIDQEELQIMSDETVEPLSKYMKRYVVSEKYKINIEENHTFECLIKDDIGLTNDEREFLLNLKTKAVSKDRLVY